MGDNEKEIENKEIHDSFGERFKALLSSFKRDDLTNVDIYNKIYGNKNIDDSSKKNKISNLRNGKTVTLDDLIAISHTFDISLDWLVFGKKDPPVQNADAEKETSIEIQPKSKKERIFEYQSLKEEAKTQEDSFIKSLLNSDYPVLQICSSFLNLLTYADISIINDEYDINNADIPQPLTLKITPKRFWVRGRYDKNREKFYIEKNCADPWMR